MANIPPNRRWAARQARPPAPPAPRAARAPAPLPPGDYPSTAKWWVLGALVVMALTIAEVLNDGAENPSQPPPASTYEVERPTHMGMVTTQTVMIRDQPTASALSIGTAKYGDFLTVYSDSYTMDGSPFEPWALVELEEGEIGWLSTTCITRGWFLPNPIGTSHVCQADLANAEGSEQR